MPNNATDMITRQIRIELDKLNSIMTDEEDKPAIIQRITELKAILDTPESEKMQPQPQPTARELIADLISAIRHR